MPSDHCGRLNDPQTSAPARPGARQEDPQQPVGTLEAQTPWRASLQNGQLVTESENLGLQAGAGPKTGAEQGKKSDETWVHRGKHYDLTKH